MPEESFDELLAAADLDAILAAALAQASVAAEVVALGEERGLVFSEEEARAALLKGRSGELDESDLEGVVGGTSRKPARGQKDFLKVTLKEVFITSF